MRNTSLSSLLFLLINKESYAWVSTTTTTSHRVVSASRRDTTRLLAIQSPTVESLTDHETEGRLLAESIARWLDSEVNTEDFGYPSFLG